MLKVTKNVRDYYFPYEQASVVTGIKNFQMWVCFCQRRILTIF